MCRFCEQAREKKGGIFAQASAAVNRWSSSSSSASAGGRAPCNSYGGGYGGGYGGSSGGGYGGAATATTPTSSSSSSSSFASRWAASRSSGGAGGAGGRARGSNYASMYSRPPSLNVRWGWGGGCRNTHHHLLITYTNDHPRTRAAHRPNPPLANTQEKLEIEKCVTLHKKRLPVTLLTGFLGSGKTTVGRWVAGRVAVQCVCGRVGGCLWVSMLIYCGPRERAKENDLRLVGGWCGAAGPINQLIVVEPRRKETGGWLDRRFAPEEEETGGWSDCPLQFTPSSPSLIQKKHNNNNRW